MYFLFVDLLGLILYVNIYSLFIEIVFDTEGTKFQMFTIQFFFFYKNEDDFPVIEDTDSRSSVTLSGSNNTKSNEVSTQMSKDGQ